MMIATLLLLANAVLLALSACPEGWVGDGLGDCLYFEETAMTWDSARSNCQSMASGAELADPDTFTKLNAINAVRQCYGKDTSYYWVGAKQKRIGKNRFQWTPSGVNLNHLNDLWFTGEPSNTNSASRQCVDVTVASEDYELADWTCTNNLKSICQVDGGSDACDESWIALGSGSTASCIWFSKTYKSWANSRTDCVDKSGDLMMIKTAAKHATIKSIRSSYGIDGAGYYYWIGAQQTAVNVNSWEWIDGTNLPLSPSPPNIWYALTSEPNNPFDPNLQCVDITASTESGDLADYWCYFPLRFACEK